MKKPGTSLGIITSGSYHDHKSSFGLNHYNALQKNVYVNGIFQTFLGTTDHQISTGVGLTYDDYAEDLSVFDLDTVFNTSEITTGIFGQYTYSYMKRLTLVAGIRADYHNLYGILITPRTHLKFDFSEHTILRLSAGRGIRSPRLIAENLGYMVSSRRWVIPVEENYEAGWNVGGNLTHDIALGNERKVTFSIDFYRTWFTKQWVIDTETDPSAVLIRPLSGESWSNSFQFNVLADIGKYFDLSLAGRYNDVRQTIYGKLEQKAFSTPLKGLMTLSFNSKHEKWSVDLTSQWHGKAVIPDYYESLEHFDLPDDYFIFHLQLTRRFKNWDIYTGCENILDFMQHKPVLGHNDPFGSHFDASGIWGPIMGRMFYAGMRYNLKSKK
jgi:outer membrane receptor for ferrienterochelin and colicin